MQQGLIGGLFCSRASTESGTANQQRSNLNVSRLLKAPGELPASIKQLAALEEGRKRYQVIEDEDTKFSVRTVGREPPTRCRGDPWNLGP